ncbi:MAG: hypothetical protein ABFD08_13335, partial [Syntrophomonas sp.]
SAATSATFISQVKDAGQASDFTTITWTDYVPANTSVAVSVRAGEDNTPDDGTGNWTSWAGVSKGGSLNAIDGKRYTQYKVVLGYTESSDLPRVDDITLNYSHYPTATNTITSSTYNTETSQSNLSNLTWNETLPSNTDIKFQLRTSADGTTWGPWCGPDDGVAGTCSSTAYFTDKTGNEIIDDTQKDKSNDQYLQYKAFLSSTDGVNTPTLSDVTVEYMIIIPSTVTTNITTNITSIGATGSGAITMTGGENPERLIEWGIQSGTYTNSCTAGTGSGTYSCNLTNLTPDTTYYYRAKATNSAGTAYGTEQSFTTLPSSVTIPDPDTTKITSAYSSGYLSLNSGTLSETTQATASTNIILSNSISTTTIPVSTNITKTEGGSFDMSQFITTNATNDTRSKGVSTLAAVKIGVPGIKMTFSQPITLTLTVGTQYNGETLNVIYQNDNEETWNPQTTCTISNGKCTFTTTHATTYSVDNNGHMIGTTDTNITTNIKDVISLDCGSNAIDLGTITPGTPNSNTITCETTTNAEHGYDLAVQRDDATGTMNHTDDGDYITDKTAWNPTTPNGAIWTGTGLGFRVRETGTDSNLYNETFWGSDDTLPNAKYAGFPNAYANIAQLNTYSDIATSVTSEIKLDVPSSQKSGAYAGSVTFQVTGKL